MEHVNCVVLRGTVSDFFLDEGSDGELSTGFVLRFPLKGKKGKKASIACRITKKTDLSPDAEDLPGGSVVYVEGSLVRNPELGEFMSRDELEVDVQYLELISTPVKKPRFVKSRFKAFMMRLEVSEAWALLQWDDVWKAWCVHCDEPVDADYPGGISKTLLTKRINEELQKKNAETIIHDADDREGIRGWSGWRLRPAGSEGDPYA